MIDRIHVGAANGYATLRDAGGKLILRVTEYRDGHEFKAEIELSQAAAGEIVDFIEGE